MKNFLYILTFIACIIAFACNESNRKSFSSNQENEETDSVPQLTKTKADSLKFRLTHHYSENYNFRVKADSFIHPIVNWSRPTLTHTVSVVSVGVSKIFATTIRSPL